MCRPDHLLERLQWEGASGDVGWSDLDICDSLNFGQPLPRAGPRGNHFAPEVSPWPGGATETEASSGFGGPECGGSRVQGRESPSEGYINIRLTFVCPKRRPLTSGNSSLTSLEVLNPPTHLSPGGLSGVVTLFLLQGWACDPGRSEQSTSFSWP